MTGSVSAFPSRHKESLDVAEWEPGMDGWMDGRGMKTDGEIKQSTQRLGVGAGAGETEGRNRVEAG